MQFRETEQSLLGMERQATIVCLARRTSQDWYSYVLCQKLSGTYALATITKEHSNSEFKKWRVLHPPPPFFR